MILLKNCAIQILFITKGIFYRIKNSLTRSIPFRIQAADPFYSEKNQAYLMESIRELDAELGQEHELIKTDDASNR